MPVVGIVLGLLLVVVAIAGGVLLWGRMRSGLPGVCRTGEGRGRVQEVGTQKEQSGRGKRDRESLTTLGKEMGTETIAWPRQMCWVGETLDTCADLCFSLSQLHGFLSAGMTPATCCLVGTCPPRLHLKVQMPFQPLPDADSAPCPLQPFGLCDLLNCL